MSKKIWTIIIGVGLIVLGIFLITEPNQAFESLIYYLGIAILVVGILKIISGIVNRDIKTYSSSSIYNGILNIIFGVILMNTTSLTIKLISVFIGIWLILSAGIQLLYIFNLGAIAKYNMLTEIVKLIIGIIVLTTPVITTVFSGLVIGIILIVIGVYTLINIKEEEKIYKVKVK